MSSGHSELVRKADTSQGYQERRGWGTKGGSDSSLPGEGSDKAPPQRMGRNETCRVNIKGQDSHAHCALGISRNSRRLEYRGGAMGKMLRPKTEFGASFHEPWMLS